MTDRPYATAEQYERWYLRDCARCGRHGNFAARWPDGHVCRTCHDRALRLRGCCPGCGQNRLLPGLRPEDRAAVCTACAGFGPSYLCSDCGQEGKLHARRRCTRCTLAARLSELLDDGTGRVRPELEPLARLLTGMDNPLSGLTWLYPRPDRIASPADLLRGLGSGQTELTHEAFHQLQPWRAAAHLRELLMSCGVLPAVDKQLLLFERWLIEHLAALTDPEQTRLLRPFTTWQVLPWLRRRAETGPLTSTSRSYASQQVKRATDFIAWVQDQHLRVADLRQEHLDRWLVTHLGHHRQNTKPFLDWAIRTKQMPHLDLPPHQTTRREPITQHRRIGLIGKLVTEDTGALRTRVAAILVLLYAQPLSRVLRLHVDDIITIDEQTFLRIGDPPSPVPDQIAVLLTGLRDQRTNMRTATNPGARWLFPGRRAGQHLTLEAIAPLIRDLGVPTVPGRVAALQQLVLQAPAPVIAQALGYHHLTTQRHHTAAGGTWNRYAAQDHEL